MWFGILALLAANVLGGAISPLFVKLGTREVPPFTFTTLRFLLAIIVFLPFFLRGYKNLKLKDVKIISFFSVFFALNLVLYAIGLQYTTIIISQTFYTLVPLIVGILAYFILKEKFTKNKIVGTVISFAGIIFILFQSLQKQEMFTFGTPVGNLIIFAAVLCWSFYLVFSRKLTKKYPATTTSFFSFFVTFVIAMPFIYTEPSSRNIINGTITPLAWISLLVTGTVSSALMFFLIQYGVKKTSAFTASVFSYFAPLLAAITAVPFANEKINLNLILGGILIVFGVFYATTWETFKKRYNSNLWKI